MFIINKIYLQMLQHATFEYKQSVGNEARRVTLQQVTSRHDKSRHVTSRLQCVCKSQPSKNHSDQVSVNAWAIAERQI